MLRSPLYEKYERVKQVGEEDREKKNNQDLAGAIQNECSYGKNQSSGKHRRSTPVQDVHADAQPSRVRMPQASYPVALLPFQHVARCVIVRQHSIVLDPDERVAS